MASDYYEIDKVFYSDGYRLAENYLSTGFSPVNLIELSNEVYNSIDSLNDAFIKRVKESKQRVDCEKGCYWCCSQAIFLNQYEALFLADYIRKNFSENQINRFKKLITSAYHVTSEMTLRTRLLYKRFCPFLRNKECLVYKARSVACRSYLSKSFQSCLYEYKYPADPDHFPELYDFPLHAARMLNEGIAAYFREHHQDVFEMTLESALHVCLKYTDPYNAWLDGKLVFHEPEFTSDELDLLDQHKVNH